MNYVLANLPGPLHSCTLRDINSFGADVGKQKRENMINVSVSFNFILFPGSQVQG